MYITLILGSPDTDMKQEFISWCLQSDDAFIRNPVLSYLSELHTVSLPENIMSMFQMEKNPVVLADLIKIIATAGGDDEVLLLVDALDHEEPLVQVAAAGGIVRILSEKR